MLIQVTMDTDRLLKVPDQNETSMDKYTASIELSNACRQFYKSRVEAADCIKSRWERHAQHTRSPGNDNDRPADDNSTAQRRQRNSIDEAMDKLRTEMVSGWDFLSSVTCLLLCRLYDMPRLSQSSIIVTWSGFLVSS